MTPCKEALLASINKWRANARGPQFAPPLIGIENCPLCAVYFEGGCAGCPVAVFTGQTKCHAMPIADLTPAVERMCKTGDPSWFQTVSRHMAELLELILEDTVTSERAAESGI